MQEITIDQAHELSRAWQKAGESWHFHALFPDCVFNTQNIYYALVLENRTTGQTYVVYSDNGFAKASQELLKLRYGNNILNKNQTPANHSDKSIRPILDQCEVYSQNHITWHHHMFFPDCIFNQNPGKWNIVMEGRGQPHILNALYDQEPVEDLQQIEIAYFKEIDPTFSE
jgi:hypothetical protein